MVLEWFLHRRDDIDTQPFPAEWLEILQRNAPVYDLLSEAEQIRLRSDLSVFIAKKNWEGCAGLELTDEMKVTIAAQACLLTLNREHHYFANVESILVYPADYHAKETRRDGSGVVNEGMSNRLGEAWTTGPIVLSWFDAQMGGSNPRDGRNVVYHEFAHKLDMTDGEMTLEKLARKRRSGRGVGRSDARRIHAPGIGSRTRTPHPHRCIRSHQRRGVLRRYHRVLLRKARATAAPPRWAVPRPSGLLPPGPGRTNSGSARR